MAQADLAVNDVKAFRQPIRRALRSEFLRHGALVFGSGVVVNAFAYVFHFFALHRLTVAEYGALSSILAALAIGTVPATIVTMIVVRYASEFHAVGDNPKLCTLSARLLRLTCVVSAVVIFCVFLAGGPIANYLRLQDRVPALLGSIVFAFTLLIPAVRGVLQAKQQFVAFAISTAMEGAGRAGFAVLFIFAGLGVRGALLGFAAGSAMSLGYTWIAVRRDWVVPAKKLFIDVPRLLRTVAGVSITTACLTTMGFVDVLLVKHYFAPDMAGIYSAVSLAGRALFFLVSFLPAIVLPKATARASRGEDARPVLLAALVMTGAIALAVLSAFAFVPVSRIAGSQYSAAGNFVLEYGIAITFLAVTGLVTTYKIALHRFDFLWVLAAVTVSEIAAICIYHPSLRAVIGILLAGHCVACFGSMYGIVNRAPVPDKALIDTKQAS